MNTTTIEPQNILDELAANPPTEPPRILVAGWPRAGKSSLALVLGAPLGAFVRHTDDLLDTYEWSALSEEVSFWFDESGPWVIDGTPLPRALRKWLARNPIGKPADRILWLPTPLEELKKGQLAMGKGCTTVWNEIQGELVKRGVRIDVVSVPRIAA